MPERSASTQALFLRLTGTVYPRRAPQSRSKPPLACGPMPRAWATP